MIKVITSYALIILGIIQIIFVLIITVKDTKGEPLWFRVLSLLGELIPDASSSIIIGVILIMIGITIFLM